MTDKLDVEGMIDRLKTDLACPRGSSWSNAIVSKADLSALLARVEELEGALKPFADVAGPIKGEVGRPTYLDMIVRVGGTEELALTTIFDTGGRGAVLWADDFRRARTALSPSTLAKEPS